MRFLEDFLYKGIGFFSFKLFFPLKKNVYFDNVSTGRASHDEECVILFLRRLKEPFHRYPAAVYHEFFYTRGTNMTTKQVRVIKDSSGSDYIT
jgi:hypothetical protein